MRTILLACSMLLSISSYAQMGSAKQVSWTYASKKIADKSYELQITANISGNYHLYATKAVVAISVLFELTSAVAAVEDPVNDGDEIVGDTIVLFVNVSVPANVAIVPVVGNVMFVTPVLVKVVL